MFYAPSLRNGFAFDDVPIIEANPVVHGLSAFPATVLTPYWGQYGQLYRPVTQLALSIDWSLGGGAPWVFHLTNVLLNALVVGLLARFALRWLPPTSALFAAMAFAIHPVHVEAVANVVGRSELLCAAALLAVMLMATSDRLTGRRRYLGIALFSALAMGSKETGALAPLLAWAAAVTLRRTVSTNDAEIGAGVIAPGAASSWRSRSAAFAALAAAGGVIPLLMIRVGLLGALTGDRPHPAFSVATLGETYALALASAVRVAGLLVAPQVPRIDYSPTLDQLAHPPWLLVAIGAVMLSGALAALIAHVRHPRFATLALVIAVVTFAPVSNVLFRSGLIVAERTLYSPSLGIAMLMGLGAGIVWMSRRRRLLLAGLLWVAPAVWIAQREIPVWSSSERVYETMRIRAPDSYKARFLVGNLRVDAGDMRAATNEYATGLALFDGDPQLLYAAGAHAMRMGDTSNAATWLARSVQLDPKNRRARGSLVRLSLATRDTALARALLTEGLNREPEQRAWSTLLDSIGR